MIVYLAEEKVGKEAIEYCWPAIVDMWTDKDGNVSYRRKLNVNEYYSRELVDKVFDMCLHSEKLTDDDCALYTTRFIDSTAREENAWKERNKTEYSKIYEQNYTTVYFLRIKNPEAFIAIVVPDMYQSETETMNYHSEQPYIVPLDKYASEAGCNMYGNTESVLSDEELCSVYSSCYMEKYVTFSIDDAEEAMSYIKMKDTHTVLKHFGIYTSFANDYVFIKEDGIFKMLQLPQDLDITSKSVRESSKVIENATSDSDNWQGCDSIHDGKKRIVYSAQVKSIKPSTIYFSLELPTEEFDQISNEGHDNPKYRECFDVNIVNQ